jgi:hypothetical protein
MTFQVQSIITNEDRRLQRAQDGAAADALSPIPPIVTPLPSRTVSGRIHAASAICKRARGESGQAGFGFDSDRGRVYLMFGPPDAIDAWATAADPYEICVTTPP